MIPVAFTIFATALVLASSATASPPIVAPPPRRGGNSYAAPVVKAFTITVTQTVTEDRFETITDTAYNSVPVTLTDLNVWTSTLVRSAVVYTPVDNDVAIQTQLETKPTTIVVTDGTSDFVIVTDVSVDHYTITHSDYKIMQSTYTRTATNTITVSTTLVRTNINTETSTKTEYRTILNTVFVQGYKH